MRQPFVAFAPLLVSVGMAAAADNCDAIRSDIESKVRAAGVGSFSISVVDAAAPAAGRVVGSCANGARKLVYQPLPAAEARRTRDDDILTECKDGSIVRGDCRAPSRRP